MKKQILIVDDDEKTMKLFSRILKRENHEIHTASSGKKALDLLKSHSFDLILLDLKMPGMNGTEVLRGVRETDQNVFLYIVTAFQNEFLDELKELKKDGIAFEILNKPVGKNHLLLAVKSILEGPLAV